MFSRQAGQELGPDQREEIDPLERDAARTRSWGGSRDLPQLHRAVAARPVRRSSDCYGGWRPVAETGLAPPKRYAQARRRAGAGGRRPEVFFDMKTH